jgi:PAS domain S-box-containing protein
MLRAIRSLMSAARALRYVAIAAGIALAASLLMAAAGAWPGPFGGILASDGFMEHGHCYLWEPWLIGLHVGSDSLIGASYVAISATLAYLVSRARRDMPFHWVFLAFGLFIVACGATHFMEVWTVWTPVYWLAGDIKLITAVASVATAVALPPLVPKVLDVIKAAKLSEERRLSLETVNEELTRLYGEVRRLDELKTDFFASVSHELRTPLTLILGPARKLKASERITAAERRSLEVIESNANILLKHVSDLLDVSKLDAGGLGVNYAEVDLARLVRLTAANFETVAADNEMAFTVEAPESAPAQVDPDKVQRVLLNLLSNAFKFTPAGGAVRCALEVDGARAWLAVEDSGEGVPADVRETVFHRFRQGGSSITRRFGGTGLGLTIVKEFVELHGGKVTIGDAPEGGASFKVELPTLAPAGADVVAAPRESAAAEAATRQSIEGLRTSLDARMIRDTGPPIDRPAPRKLSTTPLVLVVEDNREMSRFITDALAGEYRTAAAFDGREGVDKAVRLRPDLIITDVAMPGMSGGQLVGELRSRPDLDAVPIVVLSAKAGDEARVRLLGEGAQDYLMKPFAVEELSARVEKLVTMKRVRELLQLELTSRSEDITSLVDELTLRKRDLESAMEALGKSEVRFRRLFESNMLGIILADFGGHVTEANDAYLEMLGYTREDLTGGAIRWDEITPPEYRPLDRKAIEQIKARGACTPWEKEYIRKDGGRVQALVGVALLEGSSHECIAFILDVTKRKRAEEALRLSEERYRFLAEAGRVLASSLDYGDTLKNVARLAVPAVADYCLVYLLDERAGVRPVAAAHVDAAKEGLLIDMHNRYLPDPDDRANPVVKVIQSAEPELIPEISAAFLKSIASDDEQLRILEKLRPESGMVVPLVARGNRHGAITFVSAESGRRYGAADVAMAEEVARRAAVAVDNARLYHDAQEANRIKDEFLATVSHELRTPLNAILGWLHLMKTGRLDEVTSKEALGTIERNARSQAQLVEDLLDISRIITGRLRMEVRRVRLELVITSALDAVRPAAQAKSIQLHTSFDPAADEVSGDPDRLQQIIWNIVSNAIKFTPAGGRVDVSVERVAANAAGDGRLGSPGSWRVAKGDEGGRAREYARIVVSDTGEGISPEFLPHVFERFRQADGSTTRLHGGLGLGLAIVRHLVEMHGGTVQVASPGEGRGSTFTVDLPLMTSEESLGAGNNDAEKDLGLRRARSSGPGDGADFEGLEDDHNYTVNAQGDPVTSSPRDTRSPSSRYGPLSRDEGDVPPLADGEDPCDNAKSLEGLRLLVVDDEPDTRDMLNAALRQCGADVRASASAGEAVEELQRWRPHVIVADIGMPVEDGYDMIQRIRKLGPEQGGRTPAIALTAYARAEDRERALRAGYQEHIPKPVEPDDLVEAIAKLAGRNGGQ